MFKDDNQRIHGRERQERGTTQGKDGLWFLNEQQEKGAMWTDVKPNVIPAAESTLAASRPFMIVKGELNLHHIGTRQYWNTADIASHQPQQ